MSDSNVFALPSFERDDESRTVEEISIEDFCHADAMREWTHRVEQSGWTMLSYPRILIICSPDAMCVAIARPGTNVSSYINGERREQDVA